MLAQALSGIAKDLNKMSAKASVKLFAPIGGDTQANSRTLFKWIAVLTGSKNTLKGVGFFLGGWLLAMYGFQQALWLLAVGLSLVFLITLFLLPRDLGKAKSKAKLSKLFSHTPAINWLSAARFFLFGARDIWFVVALPVYLSTTLGWRFDTIGMFFALWIIGYGIIQAISPKLLNQHSAAPTGKTAQKLALGLTLIPVGIAAALAQGWDASWMLVIGLSLFAIVFAINSAVHSYLIVAWSADDTVAMNVGFYYMANAGGRLVGTLLSGLLFQYYGLAGCLIASSILIATTTVLSQKLPRT